MTSNPMAPGSAHASQSDSGARCRSLYALAPQILVAADVDDAFDLTGVVIDRVKNELPLSAEFAYPLKIALASGVETSVTLAMHHADPATPMIGDVPGAFTAYGWPIPAVTLRGNDNGSPLETTVTFNVDLSGAKAFVRADLAFTIPASGAEASIAGVAVLGGTESFPL